MKSRWKYNWIYKGGAKSTTKQYIKTLQELTWRIYFRFMKGYRGWFTPCIECQNKLDETYKRNVLMISDMLGAIMYDKNHKNDSKKVDGCLCKKCFELIDEKLDTNEEVIFGNKKYEPLVEISRTWLDTDKVEVNDKEYKENKPYKDVPETAMDRAIREHLENMKKHLAIKAHCVNINEAPTSEEPEPETPQ